MRDAIDRYKDAADHGAFPTKVGSEHYPPDLETLVNGVDVKRQKTEISAQNTDRSYDQQNRLGTACDAR